MVAADAGLRIVLQFVKSKGNGPTMCLADLVIAAHESRQRDRFRRREGSVPTGTMLDWCNRPPVVRLVFMGYAMLHELFASRRMLAFGQTGKLQGTHPARDAKLFGELATPFSLDGISLLPIILLCGSELFGVVGLSLRRRKWFRYRQHGVLLSARDEVLNIVIWSQRKLRLDLLDLRYSI
jgi:hypothetical protein